MTILKIRYPLIVSFAVILATSCQAEDEDSAPKTVVVENVHNKTTFTACFETDATLNLAPRFAAAITRTVRDTFTATKTVVEFPGFGVCGGQTPDFKIRFINAGDVGAAQPTNTNQLGANSSGQRNSPFDPHVPSAYTPVQPSVAAGFSLPEVYDRWFPEIVLTSLASFLGLASEAFHPESQCRPPSQASVIDKARTNPIYDFSKPHDPFSITSACKQAYATFGGELVHALPDLHELIDPTLEGKVVPLGLSAADQLALRELYETRAGGAPLPAGTASNSGAPSPAGSASNAGTPPPAGTAGNAGTP